MEINWADLLPVIIPSLTTLVFAIAAIVLKLKKDKLSGMGKEVSELLLSIYDGYRDGRLTPDELKRILTEAQEVIEEAKTLLNK